MAFSVNGGGGGGSYRRRSVGALSEINVVPLVDVVLVLLIIFMLTAHVMEFGLEVQVPKVKQVRDSAEELPVVTLTRNGELFLNETPVNIHRLGEEFRRRFPGEKAAFFRADGQTMWDPVAQVIAALGEQGIEVKALTQPEETGPQRR